MIDIINKERIEWRKKSISSFPSVLPVSSSHICVIPVASGAIIINLKQSLEAVCDLMASGAG
jgi:hypothetical protein